MTGDLEAVAAARPDGAAGVSPQGAERPGDPGAGAAEAGGRWLSVARAAECYGIRERSLRRRIVEGRHVTRVRSGRTEVLVPAGVQGRTAGPDHAAAGGTGPRPDGPAGGPSDAPVGPDSGTGARADVRPDVAAIDAMRQLVEAERGRSARLEAELRSAREAAAMYQERARNLEARLALPAPARPPWWAFWRRARA